MANDIFFWTKLTITMHLHWYRSILFLRVTQCNSYAYSLGKVPIPPQSDNSCLGRKSRNEDRKFPLSKQPGWTQTSVSKFMSTSKIVFTFGIFPKWETQSEMNRAGYKCQMKSAQQEVQFMIHSLPVRAPWSLTGLSRLVTVATGRSLLRGGI